MKLSLGEWLAKSGYSSLEQALEAYGVDSVHPALCSEDCIVETDGHCPHAAPSLLLATGLV